MTFKTAHLLAAGFTDLERFDDPNIFMNRFKTIDPDLEKVRAQLNAVDAEQRAELGHDLSPSEHWIVPPDGEQPAVDLYVYRPQSALPTPAPVLYFLHGGGYLLGNARRGGEHLFALAEAHQAVLVSVEYRTAREAPYPADLNDAYHGLKFLHQNAAALGLDAKRLVVFGESAGGGLAARLCLKVRDRAEIPLAGQVLIYPMLDYRTGSAAAEANPHVGEFYWTAPLNQLGWTMLRGGQTIPESELAYFSASLAKDVSGLPPTFIVCGGLDLFVNENIDYANRLNKAGVKVDLLIMQGIYHAFEQVKPEAEQSALALAASQMSVRNMLK